MAKVVISILVVSLILYLMVKIIWSKSNLIKSKKMISHAKAKADFSIDKHGKKQRAKEPINDLNNNLWLAEQERRLREETAILKAIHREENNK